MDGSGCRASTIEEIYKDFRGRRAGLIKALTTEAEKFYQQCSPEKEGLCLYGFPSETWEVKLPAEELPPELPEPALGINFSRDGMQVKDWLSIVALQSDAWLLSVAFYFGGRFGFGKRERRWLFRMINNLPTLFETLRLKDQQSKDDKSMDEEEEQGEETRLCGACGGNYACDEFWICCDVCERWFHGKCVKITPEKALHMKRLFNCPSCFLGGRVKNLHL